MLLIGHICFLLWAYLAENGLLKKSRQASPPSLWPCAVDNVKIRINELIILPKRFPQNPYVLLYISKTIFVPCMDINVL